MFGKPLQSAGNIREETDKAINLEAFAKCDEQRSWQDALVSWNADLLGCLSILKEGYWSVIIKTLSLICLPRSWKFVPQLFSQPHKLIMLSNSSQTFFQCHQSLSGLTHT